MVVDFGSVEVKITTHPTNLFGHCVRFHFHQSHTLDSHFFFLPRGGVWEKSDDLHLFALINYENAKNNEHEQCFRILQAHTAQSPNHSYKNGMEKKSKKKVLFRYAYHIKSHETIFKRIKATIRSNLECSGSCYRSSRRTQAFKWFTGGFISCSCLNGICLFI